MIHIDDNFFNDPYQVRNHLIKKKDWCPDINYVGYRSYTVPEFIQNTILSKAKSIIQEDDLSFAQNPTFQYSTKEYLDGIYHRDIDEGRYICIVYLALDPPSDSGTEVCDSEQLEHPIGNNTQEKRDFLADPTNLIKRYRYGRLRRNVNSFYKPIMKVPNKFNRGLIFPASNFHRAQNSFGTSIVNSRMTVVSFLGGKMGSDNRLYEV